MKNKNKLIFFALLASISLFCFILNKKMEIENNQQLHEKLYKKEEFKKMNEELNEKISQSFIQDILCEDVEGNMHSLSGLVSQHPVLFYRYSELHCTPCYESELISLQEYFSEMEQNIGILCSFQSKRYFILSNRERQIKLSFFRIAHDAFDWSLEEHREPYFFVLHPDMKISHIYVPNKAYPESNKQYLEGVKRFLLE